MLPILLSLGPIKIYSFGVFLLLAVIVGSFVVWREGRQAKFGDQAKLGDEEKLFDLVLFEIIFGLVGARIYYLLFHLEDFGLNLFRWLLILHFPGLSFIGALIGGLVGTLIFARKNNYSFWQIGDFLVLGISLAEVIGRLGAFLSGSAYGAPTSLPWGVSMIGLVGRQHPSQIYEGLAALLTFLVLWQFKKFCQKKNLASGIVFLLYFLIFGVVRFFLEFFRGDSVYLFGWRSTQIVCLVFIFSAAIMIYRRLGRSVKNDIMIFLEKVKSKKSKVKITS